MKTALILPPSSASFHVVAGVPLIQRTVLSALRAGFDRVVVIGREHSDQLRALFESDARTRAVEVTNDLPAVAGDQVAVIASDCLLTADTLRQVDSTALNGRPLLFAAPGHHGIALCRPAMLAGIDVSALAAGGVERLWADLGAHGVQPVALDGVLCTRISDVASIEAAEVALCERLRADSAVSDGPLAHWIDRRISLRLSRWLVQHTRLRPNHITIIGTAVGLCAAAVLSIGTYWAGVAGTLLFLCTTIIDGCDGEVARLKFQESSFGEKFDVITDNIVHVAIFVGLAFGVYHRSPDINYRLLVSVLLGGFACDLVASYFFLVHRPGFASSRGAPVTWKGRTRQRVLSGLEALMNRDFAYLLVLFAVTDRLAWFVWGCAFGTYLFAGLLVWVYRWRDAG